MSDEQRSAQKMFKLQETPIWGEYGKALWTLNPVKAWLDHNKSKEMYVYIFMYTCVYMYVYIFMYVYVYI